MHKLIGSLVLVVLIATVGLGWGVDQLFFELTKRDSDPVTAYKTVGSDLAATADKIDDQARFLEVWSNNSAVTIDILRPEDIPLPSELQAAFFEGEPVALESETGVDLYFYLQNSDRILAMSPPNLQQSNQYTRIRLFLTVLFYTGIILLTLLWLYPLVKRLLNLSKVARAFGGGNFQERIKLSNRSYISDIEREFNHMAQRIETLVDDNKLLSSAVSHDLRTPLSRLRFGVDALTEFDDENSRKKYIPRISNDLTEMENLVEVLLDFAKLDRRFDEVERHSIFVKETIHSALDGIDLDGKQLSYHFEDDSLIFKVNSQYMSMLLKNLLQNAVRYAAREIMVSVQQQDSDVVLHVDDDGPGIAETDREAMMKPFVRMESVTRDKGYGMGLAIVRRVALVHAGRFEIAKSESLGGASMRVTIPVKN